MAFDDRYIDEEGEPIMDPDMPSDREEYDAEPADEDWNQGQSSSPAYDSEGDASKTKQRKRLKKHVHGSSDEEGGSHGKKGKEGMSTESFKKRKHRDDASGKGKKSGSKMRRLSKSGAKGESSRGDNEMKEMWDSIAGFDSEEDQEGVRTREDDAFIDDTGVDPRDRYHSENEGSIGDAPQAEEGEEDDEISKLFRSGKKKNKKNVRTAEETAMLVEQFMAKLEVAAEEDAELNRASKPAVNKLKMLPMLTEVLSKKQLQEEFLDRGVLSVLKNWLEPLPDGCLPNANVRSALLKILADVIVIKYPPYVKTQWMAQDSLDKLQALNSDFACPLPINVGLYERKEQLKKSGLGKVVMFLSRTDEETPANRKLARELVDKWSRPIFHKSTDYGEMRRAEDDIAQYRRPQTKKAFSRPVGLESRDDDLDLVETSQEPKPGDPGYRQHASRPEPMPMDFIVRPESKIDPEEIRARHKQLKQDERRQKMNKKLQQLKAPKKKRLQATKISVEGRGMVKYF